MCYDKSVFHLLPRLIELEKIYKREQYAYGHREILLRYIGVDNTHLIQGRLQHGLWPEHYNESYLTHLTWSGFAPFYVFSKAREQEAHRKKYFHVKAIGAPWFYMKRNNKINIQNNSKRRGVLIMPEHSSVNYIDQSTLRDKIYRASCFRKIVGTTKATVCLHFQDFLDPATRFAFEKFDFNVTCVGSGINITPWSPSGNRINFLKTLSELMNDHKYFMTDTFATPVMYAIDMEMEIGIFPDLRKLLKLGHKGANSIKDPLLINHRIYIAHLKKTSLKNSINNFIFKNDYNELLDHYLGKSLVLSRDEARRIIKVKKRYLRY